MNNTTILYVVLAIAVSCFLASFLLAPTTEDIPYTVLDDSNIESHITKSYLDNGNLIIDIYNPNCEIVKVEPATIEHHVTAGMDSVKIFNYTNQYFEVIVGNASDVYTFGNLTKTWDAKNKTVIIGTLDGESLLTIERVSINPDLCTFEEVLNITSYVNYELNNLKDFRSRWRQFKGTNNITSVDWYIQKNQSYNVVVPEYGLIEQSQIIPNIIEYKDVTTTWECGNCAIGNCNSSQYWNISRNTANGTESGTICFDSYEVLQNPLKIKIYWNKTGVIGSHNETNYRNVWKQFSPVGKTIHAGQSYVIKVVYHKKPELGDVRIQTIPLFRGVECDELTWWNTSWSNKREIKIDNTGGSALTDYQVNVNLTFTPINSTSLRVVNETADATVPHWQETISAGNCTDLWFNATSIVASAWLNETYYIYYGNVGVASDVDGTATFIQYQGATSTAYKKSNVVTQPFVYEAKVKRNTDGLNYIQYGMGINSVQGDDSICLMSYSPSNQLILRTYDNGANTDDDIVPDLEYNTWYNIKIVESGLSLGVLSVDTYADLSVVSNLSDAAMGMLFSIPNGMAEQDWSFVRKYTATEPTATLGAEEDGSSIASYAPPTPLNKLEGESQYFNVTTNMNCQCRWYINGSLKQTNTTQQTEHNYTNTSLELGYFNFSAVVNTSSGETNMQTWWVTVTDPPFIPPNPINLTNTTGNFWIRHAWDVGAGNITDEYAVNVNGSWYNTSNTFINLSKSPHGYQNITVQAWNSTGVGTLSAGTLSDNVSLPNNPVTLTNYSLVYSIQEFDTITIDFDYTDADGDVVTFATDAVNGTLDNGTGVWNWTTTWMDRSVNHWIFNVSDGYGSVDSVVVEIEVTAYPITDLNENWQYHESDDPSDTWDVYAAGNGYQTGWGSSHGDQTVSTTITGTLTKSLKLYAYAWSSGGPITSYCTAHATIQAPTLSDYLSFVVRAATFTKEGTSTQTTQFKIYLYDIEGYLINSYDLTSYATADHSNDSFELTRLSDNLYLRVNGDNKGIIGTCNEQISYIRFYSYAYVQNPYDSQGYWDKATSSITIDDITTGTAINGIGVDHSDAPAYANTHTWADSELWTVPPTITTTYGLKTTPIADYTAAEYTMKVQRVLTSEYVNTTIIKPAGEAPNSTQKPCGTVSLSQPTLFGDNYGMYNFIIDKDGTTVATDYIYWMNMDVSGNSYVVVDNPTYPAGAQISPSYFIDNINLLEYKYYIKTLSLFGTQMDMSSDLLVDTGTVDVDTTGYDVTSYWCILVRETRADGVAVEMASDLFAITNTISVEGIVYNAESGDPLGDSKVALYQNGLWYNTTTNSTTGEYNLSDLTTDIDITVYAEHTGYTHDDFTFTPLVAGIIPLDIYMIPDTPSYTGTAIGGLVLYAPYYQALNGATANLWNSSWNDDTASSATGYYLFDNIVNGSFTGNATMEGYSAASSEEITTASGTYTYQNYLLQPQNILTVKAKDVSTHATLMTFSVVFDEGVTYETTDGFVNITTGIGIYKVEVSADGYYVGIDYTTVVSDTEITLYLVPVEESGEGIYYPSHYVSFIVQSITGTLYTNVTASVYNTASSNGTALFSDVTGSDGVVGFELNETTLYRITFVDAAQGINEEFTLYPIDTEYVVIVSSSISFITETPDTNLTNTTVEYTNQSWSIQNLTGDYLSTTLGISHTGQGVIAATICWATCTVACGVPTIAVLAILAQLGVVSWIMVLFTGMTMLSIYILGGKIG